MTRLLFVDDILIFYDAWEEHSVFELDPYMFKAISRLKKINPKKVSLFL